MQNQEIVTSGSNNTVKYVKSLMRKKYREEHHRFIVEGEKVAAEALNSDFKVEMLVFSEAYSGSIRTLAENQKIPSHIVKEHIFKSLSDTQSPQGVLAVIEQKEFDFTQIIGQTGRFLVILDGVRDPGNLGTIVRTVDAAGGDGVILIHDCVDPYNPKTVRATMGSILRIPIYRGKKTEKLIDDIDQAGWHIAASDLQGTDVFTWQGRHKKTALVIGSESHGVSEQTKKRAHSLIKIPMAGGAESLNASVAAGILVYEIFRKRRKKDG